MTENGKRKEDRDDAVLDALFAEARGAATPPSDDLMQRVLSDAEAVLRAAPPAVRPVPRRPRWRVWLAVVGGWPAVAGMASAVVAGIWIGTSPPEYLDGLGDYVLTSEADVYLTELFDSAASIDGEG